jgi:FtsZ-interacting cell division protein ZipA
MFETAYCLAKELDAKIRDESREPLTLDVEQRLRDRVREFVAYRLSKERK